MQRTNVRVDPVVVLSPGRSGSTLMQRYLNCSDDLLVWGEHGGFFRGLATTYHSFFDDRLLEGPLLYGRQFAEMLLSSRLPVGPHVDVEWTNNFDGEDFRLAFRDLVMDILTVDVPPTLRWGFKEIRYGEPEIRFIKELFPQAQFVFMVRDPIDTLASSIAAWESTGYDWKDRDNLPRLSELVRVGAEQIYAVAVGMKRWYRKDQDLLVRFEDLKADPVGIVSQAAAILEISPPAKEKVLAVSSDVKGAVDSTDVKRILRGEFRQHHTLSYLLALYGSFGYEPYDWAKG